LYHLSAQVHNESEAMLRTD